MSYILQSVLINRGLCRQRYPLISPRLRLLQQRILNLSNLVIFIRATLTPDARAQVQVLPHSTAPLAPRVTIPPIPSKLPLPTFQGMSLELQEAVIIEDILFVLMAYIRMNIRLIQRASKENISVITKNTTIQMNSIDFLAHNLELQLALTPVSLI
jgi:hypothetical protein